MHKRAGGQRDGRAAADGLNQGGHLGNAFRRRQLPSGGAHAHQRLAEEAAVVHHALGHAGGAAGVEHVDAQGIPLDARHGLSVTNGTFIVQGAIEQGFGAVVHLDVELHLGQAVAYLPDARGVRGLENHCFGIGVVEQIHQFVGLVAVVHVDWAAADLERCVLRFEILAAVVQVSAHFRINAQAVGAVHSRQPSRPVIELAPSANLIAADHGGLLANGVRNDLPSRGEVKVHPSFPYCFAIGAANVMGDSGERQCWRARCWSFKVSWTRAGPACAGSAC